MTDKIKIEMTLDELATIQHDIWLHWMQYLFKCGVNNSDGTFTINAEKVKRWMRQMVTDYGDLSDAEKQSDRKVASFFYKLHEVIKMSEEKKDDKTIEGIAQTINILNNKIKSMQVDIDKLKAPKAIVDDSTSDSDELDNKPEHCCQIS